MLDEKVKAMYGYELTEGKQYQMCNRVNGTFLDCPIADFDLSSDKDTYIAIHNPSS
jgi:hypothetical protein